MLEPRAMSGTPREPPRGFEAPSVSQLFKRSDAELRMCHKWVGTLAVLLRNVALAKSEGRTSLDEPRERGRVHQRAPQREHERRSRSPRQRDMQSPPAQRDMRSPIPPQHGALPARQFGCGWDFRIVDAQSIGCLAF